MNAAIPVLLLTGYLGAGKTTMLGHLLTLPSLRERRLALLVNEFGALGVDGSLVAAGDRPLIELNKGSLFCSCVRGDFLLALERIARDLTPELVLIEATGVAEPRELEALVDDPALAARFDLRANLCLVDALNFFKVLPNLKAARSQAARADGLVLNKVDLVDEAELERLRRALRELNPQAPLAEVSHGRIGEDFLWGLTHRPLTGAALREPPDPVFSESFRARRPISRTSFVAAVNELSENILRLKGYLDFGQGPRYVELVGGQLLERPAYPVHGRDPYFVAIGWKVRQAELRERFARFTRG